MHASGAATARQIFEHLEDIVFFVIDRIRGAGFISCHGESVRKTIDGDHAVSTKQLGAGNRKLTYRSGTPDCDDLTASDVAHIGAHVAGGQDVRKKEHLVVG